MQYGTFDEVYANIALEKCVGVLLHLRVEKNINLLNFIKPLSVTISTHIWNAIEI